MDFQDDTPFSEDERDEVVNEEEQQEGDIPIDDIEDGAEPEPEQPEVVEEEKPKVTGKVPAKTRINQIQREKFQALEQARRLAEENERLKSMVAESSAAATKHYADKVLTQLEQAKKMKLEAIEQGDAQALIEADQALSRATYAEQELQRDYAQRQYESQNYQQQARQQEDSYFQADERVAQQWASANEWFDEGSDNYDAELSSYAQSQSEQLDQQLMNQGRGHVIGSQAYFDEINKRVSQAAQFRQTRQPQQRNQLAMKRPNTPVSPARGSTSTTKRPGTQITREQARMAAKFGVSQAEYMKHKIHQDKQGLTSVDRRGYR